PGPLYHRLPGTYWNCPPVLSLRAVHTNKVDGAIPGHKCLVNRDRETRNSPERRKKCKNGSGTLNLQPSIFNFQFFPPEGAFFALTSLTSQCLQGFRECRNRCH